MKKIIIFSTTFLLVFTSCRKTGIGGSGYPDGETAKYFLYGLGGASAGIGCYNANKTIQWRRDTLGSIDPTFTYSNGIVYAFINDFDFVTQTASCRFYAIDVNTGIDIWSTKNSQDYIYDITIRNDTVFAGASINSVNKIAAYDAKTGSLLWAVPISDYAVNLSFLTLKGNVLYFLSSLRGVSVNAFDLTTKTFKWRKSIAVYNGFGFTRPVFNNGQLILTDEYGRLFALNENTGETVWSQNSGVANLHQPVVANNLIYAANDSSGSTVSLWAFKAQDGSIAWQYKNYQKDNYWVIGGLPYVSGNNLFITYYQGFNNFVASIDANNGHQNWVINLGTSFPGWGGLIAVVGNNVYGFGGDNAKVFDYSSGILKDSLPIVIKGIDRAGIVTSSGNYITPN